MQSIVTGILAGAVAFAVGTMVFDAGWTLATPIKTAILSGTSSAFTAWIIGISAWRGSLYPEPPPPPASTQIIPAKAKDPIRVEVVRDQGRTVDFIDLPASEGQLYELSVGLLNGKGLTVDAWAGPGGTFSRSEFAALRAAMMQRGMAQWTAGSKSQGAELTEAGRVVMERIAQHSPTPQAG